MADVKKYVSLDKLTKYDTKIKGYIGTKDDEILAAAKAHAEGLASNYDAAGAAATVQGELDKEVLRAKAREDEIAGLVTTAQGEVDALESLVGTLPSGTAATSVVDYVNLKTAGIATDAALGELNNQVSGLQGVVDGIVADHLTSADKTELSDLVKAEENRAKGIEDGLESRLATVEANYLDGEDKTELQGAIDGVAEDVAEIAGDYLKASDKTELQGKIDAKVAQVDYDAKMEEIGGDIDGLQTQINTIMNNPDAEGAINSINEFTQYVADHGTIAEGFRTDIDENKADIAAEVKRAGEVETGLSARIDVLEAINHEAYVGADAALKSELEGKISLKADASALTEAVQTLEGADKDIVERLDAIELQLGDGEGSVADMIGDAKQEAIDAAADDATSKADAAEAAAKGHADGLNTAMDSRVQALEAIDHEHSNKTELDLIVSGDKAKWDEAYTKRHEHSNLTVLEGITSAKITEWDKVSGKAEQTALQGEIDRATAAEQGLADAIAAFVEVSEEEINALFA